MVSSHYTHNRSTSHLNTAILIVDGNDGTRRELLALLAEKGYACAAATSGDEAKAMLEQRHFDLVFLNVSLPDMNGVDFIRHLQTAAHLEDLPVIVTGSLEEQLDATIDCLNAGAEDYLFSQHDIIFVEKRMKTVLKKKVFEKQVGDLLHVVIPIGARLSTEGNFNILLEMILEEAKNFCNADAGTLYLRTEKDTLRFVIVRNDSLQINMGGSASEPVTLPEVPLYDPETQEPNESNVASYTALTEQTINIEDAYNTDAFDFSGTKRFDEHTGYHSVSFLTVPLTDSVGEVIGVLQLLNAKSRKTEEIIPFDTSLEPIVESMAALATVVLKAYIREEQLRHQIAEMKIDVDESRTSREVAQITETKYFQQLQERAQDLRKRGRTRNT